MQALLVVDFQNDFLAHGALAVPGADAIAPLINQLMRRFQWVIASQDWHPKGHVSFLSARPIKGRKGRGLWPDHCIQGTFGAALSDTLETVKIKKIIYKGTRQDTDSYSVFFNDEEKKEPTELNKFLKGHGITTLVLVGVALEYCVAATAVDGVALGYKVIVLEDGVASLCPLQECKKFFIYLIEQGVEIATSSTLFNL